MNQIDNSFNNHHKSPEEVLESEEAKIYNILMVELNRNFDEFMQTLNDIDPFDDSDDLGDW
jgi:hypothetical protein